MAVFQFKLDVIPRNSISDRFEEIPPRLFINHEGWVDYFENGRIEDKPSFEDARTINWWKGIRIDIEELAKQIDQIIPRAHYSKPEFLNWKGKSQIQEDNDAAISINEENEIEDFGFRIDLRDPDKFPRVLESMLNICSENDWMVMDVKGNLMEPTLKDVGTKLLDSNAVKFLIDPEDFLRKL